MTREWKPGDVALVDYGTGVEVMMRDRLGWFSHCSEISADDGAIESVRPLVVIDPDDREQIERLRDLYDVEVIRQNGDPDPRDVTPADRSNAIQAALREFADPPSPRPDEPLLLGAVVEDGNGVLWVRAGDSHDGVLDDNWRQVAGERVGQWQRWDRIASPRVLSPGYDPGATS